MERIPAMTATPASRLLTLLCATLVSHETVRATTWLTAPAAPRTGSVIFLHPDGTSASHWTAARLLLQGPDGVLNWDRLPRLALYRGHMRDAVAATSHGGATSHAFGRKVPSDSYGMDGQEPLVALSGKPMSIMREAITAGFPVGTVNSGNIDEPGTGVFLASTPSRKAGADIALQVVRSGAAVILAGGERWLLPQGARGRHGEGARTDGLDLIAEARAAGYAVVFDRAELANLPETALRVLGVFAHHHSFHDEPEESLRTKGLPLYLADAPTLAEMTEAALRILARHGKPFLLVVEEEGTDNFANVNNAAGTLEALRRADEAIGVARAFLAKHPDTLIFTAADSDASGLEALAIRGQAPGASLPAVTSNGAPLDGRDGTGTPPFLAAADAQGLRLPFGIAWTAPDDGAGGILVRAEGLHADALARGACDNTDVYRLMYLTLFGRLLP